MPKKSNKTDHVLNLLTSGRPDEDSQKKQPATQAVSAPSPIMQVHSQEPLSLNLDATPKRRVVVEESKMRDDLSNLVRQGLENEINAQKKPKHDSKPFIILDEDISVTKVYSEEDMSYVSSRPYILEDFDESGDSNMSNDNFNLSCDIKQSPDEFLHNVAEDIMISKAPAIMESMNMCTCSRCVYDVVALALNNTKPLYTVTKKGELFQKLASTELQYGTDISREITRACLQIKINPRHTMPSD